MAIPKTIAAEYQRATIAEAALKTDLAAAVARIQKLEAAPVGTATTADQRIAALEQTVAFLELLLCGKPR